MKTYHLRFTENDFSKTYDAATSTYTWTTGVVDLYRNSQYRNYSVRKHINGTNLLGNGVYTGINKVNATTSEIGFVENGRFIDTSGQVDIVDWSITLDPSIFSLTTTYLSVYSTVDAALQSTPSINKDQWAYIEAIPPGAPIYQIDSGRYAFFQLNFTIDPSVSIAGKSVELIVSVEIDPPVINGYFPATRKLQDKFPEWMDIREYNPEDPLGATPATPSSLGGQFINAVYGEWLTDLSSLIQYQEFQYFIDTVDLSQKAWAFVAQGAPLLIWSITGDGTQLARTSSIGEFYDSNPTEDCFFWNRNTREVYCNKYYSSLIINGVSYSMKPYQVWNSLDDIGISVDLLRLRRDEELATPNGYLEDNDSFRKRILDVYRNRPGVSVGAFQKTMRRELNLWRYYGATPDSNYLGATPDVFEIKDLESNPKYFTPEGMPTQTFKELVEELAVKYPLTWGYFRYQEAFWDSDGLKHEGMQTLPRQLDATPVSERYLESGVGDGNDMYVFKPKSYTGPNQFSANVKVRGRSKTTRSEYLPLAFDVKVYGVAAEDVWTNPIYSGNFTIELTVVEPAATPSTSVYYNNFTVSSRNDTDYFHATPTDGSIGLVEWSTPSGYTDVSYQFKNKNTGMPYPSTQISLAKVTQVRIIPGHYNGNFATPAYENAPTQSNYKLWFDGIPASNYLGAGGLNTFIIQNPYVYSTHSGMLRFQSQVTVHTGATPGSWTSDVYTYRVNLNGGLYNQVQNFTLQMPTIVFPASTSTRSYVVEIVTNNNAGTYGTYSDVNAATPVFLPATYIQANGSAVWSGGNKQTFATSTTSVVFSSASGSAYPSTVPVWSMFESSIISPLIGTVDENGPWRYGQSLKSGNTNYLFQTLALTRDSFGIANNSNYIITWIGIGSVSNANVICWLSGNTVKPAVSDPAETNVTYNYPTTAIAETYNSTTGKYEFAPINLYARLKPGVNDKWNPKAHSGWFYDDIDEYYMYANPALEQATGNFKILNGVNRQGAPILVYGNGSTPMRQTAFFNDPATPTFTLVNTQVIQGNGTKSLYGAYKDIYNISVIDTITGATVPTTYTSTSSNVIALTNNTDASHSYSVSYIPRNSFYADNGHMDATPTNRTRVVFDKSAPQNGFTTYSINYETSLYDPATPIDIPLNNLYTSIDEGFIFIDHDIRPLNQIEVKISPTKIIADAIDYAIVTFRTFDTFGNPKPYQNFNIYTNFGTFDKSSVTTDLDGFAYATLQSELWDGTITPYPATPVLPAATPSSSTQGVILVDGVIDAKIGFDIQIPIVQKNRVVAVLDSDFILSDGVSSAQVFGRVETAAHVPVPYAVVQWRKARTIYELFNKVSWSSSQATPGSTGRTGQVVADANGRFSIGPFTSNPVTGYWMVSVESGSASPNFSNAQYPLSGDVVYWYEYPNITKTIDPITSQPETSVQSATPYWSIPTYSYGSTFPTTYDESVPQAASNSATPAWQPPTWYAIDRYVQYQMGLANAQNSGFVYGAYANDQWGAANVTPPSSMTQIRNVFSVWGSETETAYQFITGINTPNYTWTFPTTGGQINFGALLQLQNATTTITRTDRGQVATTGGVSALNTVTSGSMSPAAGARIIVMAYSSILNLTNTLSVTDTFPGTSSWTEHVTIAGSRSGYIARLSIFTAVLGNNPGTGTITVTRTAGSYDQWMNAEFTELNAGTIVIGSASNTNSVSTSLTVVPNIQNGITYPEYKEL